MAARERLLVVNVAELLRRPGTRRSVEVDEPLIGVAVTASCADRIVGSVVLESMNDRLGATGRLAISWHGECRRCLDPVAGVVDVDVREVFERVPVEGETYLLEADQLDLGPLVRDAALLGLPLAPLCRADCPGPAPERYPSLAAAEPPTDPRWAALDQLR